GHLLLRAWRQYDPDGTGSVRLGTGSPARFLDLLLRRLNEYRQAAWIEYVRAYPGPWYDWKEEQGHTVLLISDRKDHADLLWRRPATIDETEVLRLLWAYLRGSEETPALHVPLVNALCYAIAGTVRPVPGGDGPGVVPEPGPFAPECFLAPRL